jgi:transcription elongation GreA/GreB family factor
MSIKASLVIHCLSFLSQKIETIEDTISELKRSAASETKSSVGDKYETGRAMIQLEIEKNLGQLKIWKSQYAEVERLDPNKSNNRVVSGAIVKCSNANYFIAQACAKAVFGSETYYTISPEAPIAQAMLNKSKGEEFIFNAIKMQIVDIL